MKKLLGLLIVTVLSSSAIAQGTVRFFNSPTTLISYGGWGGPVGSLPPYPSSVFYFALLTAPAGTTDPLAFTFTGLYATNTAATTGGRIQGGSGLGVTCPNWPVNEQRSFEVVGWSAEDGVTFNPQWLTAPGVYGLHYWGMSMIATGRPGGFDPITGATFPPLAIFSGATINSGFDISAPWQPPPPPQLWVSPSVQSVLVGTTAVFSAQGSSFRDYQWAFSGTNIPGATYASLIIPNVQPWQAGAYSVTASGCACGAWPPLTSYATLEVLSPPSLMVAPNAQTVPVGSSCVLLGNASGTPPLLYQWSFSGTNLTGMATNNRVLRLSNLQLSESGAYLVTVSNVVGTVTSTGIVSVIPAVQQRLAPALSVGGTPGQTVHLDACPEPDFGSGSFLLGSVLLTNASQFFVDSAFPLDPQRYYHAWREPGPGLTPRLQIYAAPAISLTGSFGTTVRIDYLNQFGPTDAWVPLANIILTNTSQEYFDTSAIGQPPRLYRLTPGP